MGNTLLANTMWTFSAEGVCGASLLTVSFALSAPSGDRERQGRYVVLITNDSTTVPLHVEPRVVFTDARGTSTTVVHPIDLISNTQTFGGSAAQIRSLVLLLSGQDAAVPMEVLAGSALQIWILAASNPASSVVVSGAAALWRV